MGFPRLSARIYRVKADEVRTEHMSTGCRCQVSRFADLDAVRTMEMRVKNVMVIVFVALIVADVHSQPIKCSTPNSLEGECIFLDLCPSILALQNSTDLSPEDISFLRRSQCDYEELQPRVCCPVSTKERPFHLPEEHKVRKPTPVFNRRFKPPKGLPSLNECGRQSADNKIFNGEYTAIDEFPWMALLEYNMKQSSGHGFACGGALISHQHVLTAAHCVIGKSEEHLGGLIRVRLGEHNIDTKEDCDDISPEDCADPPIDLNIEKKIVHPNYDEDSMDQMHDIAILKLDTPVQFTDFIRPICLSKELPPQVHAPGHVQFVAGWGQTETGRTSPVKKKLKVPLVDEASCSDKYRPFHIKIWSRQLCAGGERDKDSCGGDSGGPLMVQAVSKSAGAVWYMTGVVSIGPQPCASNKIPGIYTKVFDYLDWILENVMTM